MSKLIIDCSALTACDIFDAVGSIASDASKATDAGIQYNASHPFTIQDVICYLSGILSLPITQFSLTDAVSTNLSPFTLIDKIELNGAGANIAITPTMVLDAMVINAVMYMGTTLTDPEIQDDLVLIVLYALNTIYTNNPITSDDIKPLEGTEVNVSVKLGIGLTGYEPNTDITQIANLYRHYNTMEFRGECIKRAFLCLYALGYPDVPTIDYIEQEWANLVLPNRN